MVKHGKTKRQVYYSFHYQRDHWRAFQVSHIGGVEGNSPVSEDEWEEITKGGDGVIEQWINDRLIHKSCTVVLVGTSTANRKWINYEIIKSWNEGKGVVGIYIHGLKNSRGQMSPKGYNPFDYITLGTDKILSARVKCYEPVGANSEEKYAWIYENISNLVEEAIHIRNECSNATVCYP